MVLGLAVVAVAALVLLMAAAVTRRPVPGVPDRDAYHVRWSALHGGYDAGSAPLVGAWLGVVHRLARPLARAGLAPDVVTLWGLLTGALALALGDVGGRWALATAALAVVGSGVLDGLDGAVAVLTDRVTPFGSVLDSVVDRLTDVLYLLALWRVGAPAALCVAAGVAVVLLEYARARAGQAGMTEIGVVTVGERPTRVIVTAATLGCAAVYVGAAGGVAATGAAATLALSLLGLVQLLRVVRRRLA